MKTSLISILSICILASIAGCGGSAYPEKSPETALRDTFAVIIAEDWEAVCNTSTLASNKQAMEIVQGAKTGASQVPKIAAEFPEFPEVVNCPSALEWMNEQGDLAAAIKSFKIGKVSIDEDRARISLSSKIGLEKSDMDMILEDGEWKTGLIGSSE